MKSIKQILENGSTQALLALSFVTTVCGAGIAAILVAALASPQTHASANGSASPTPHPIALTASLGSGPKTAHGTEVVHGALSGSVEPGEDQPWRHWLK